MVTREQRTALVTGAAGFIGYHISKNLLKEVPVNKVKAFEANYIEFLNAKHRDVLDALKAGKLTDEVIDTLTKVAKEISEQFKA